VCAPLVSGASIQDMTVFSRLCSYVQRHGDKRSVRAFRHAGPCAVSVRRGPHHSHPGSVPAALERRFKDSWALSHDRGRGAGQPHPQRQSQGMSPPTTSLFLQPSRRHHRVPWKATVQATWALSMTLGGWQGTPTPHQSPGCRPPIQRRGGHIVDIGAGGYVPLM